MIDVVARSMSQTNKMNIQNLAMGSLVIANDSITDAQLINTGIKQVVMDNTNAINNKIKAMIFTSTIASTTHIVHNLSYNNLTDELEVKDLKYGETLILGSNYTENADSISIDLLSWSLDISDRISFKVFKNIK